MRLMGQNGVNSVFCCCIRAIYTFYASRVALIFVALRSSNVSYAGACIRFGIHCTGVKCLLVHPTHFPVLRVTPVFDLERCIENMHMNILMWKIFKPLTFFVWQM